MAVPNALIRKHNTNAYETPNPLATSRYTPVTFVTGPRTNAEEDRRSGSPFLLARTHYLSDDNAWHLWYTELMMNGPLSEHGHEKDRMMQQPIRVLIADDRPRSRHGLRALLMTYPDIEVVGEAADGQEAVRLVEEYLPDVMLMDVRMPVMDGLEATRLIKGKWPAVKVVVLSMYSGHQTDAMAAGADAFVSKGDSPETLWTTVSQIA